jgi:hypothetical protein
VFDNTNDDKVYPLGSCRANPNARPTPHSIQWGEYEVAVVIEENNRFLGSWAKLCVWELRAVASGIPQHSVQIFADSESHPNINYSIKSDAAVFGSGEKSLTLMSLMNYNQVDLGLRNTKLGVIEFGSSGSLIAASFTGKGILRVWNVGSELPWMQHEWRSVANECWDMSLAGSLGETRLKRRDDSKYRRTSHGEAAVGANGKRLAVRQRFEAFDGSEKEEVQIRDASTMAVIGSFVTDAMSDLCFAADGSHIDTTHPPLQRDQNWQTRQWKTFADLSSLIAYFVATVPRCLTPGERREYALEQDPPAWCIERGKWPYYDDAWKVWLANLKGGRRLPAPE